LTEYEELILFCVIILILILLLIIIMHRLRVFENRELRRIFGPKRDEATGGWRKQHNEELHNL
jgi:predicted Holliday junction resolvase-like endonuclease